MVRQYITRYIKPLTANTFRHLPGIYSTIALTFFLSTTCFAKPELTYGPVQKGQTLWQIAEETSPNKAIAVEQIAYAFYNLNLDAFHSGNMNLLKEGSYIKIPDTDTVLKTNKKVAKNKLSQHVHALELLRVEAKQLKRTKAKTRKYRNQIKRTQKRLAKYRYESSAWNSTYRKLVKAKRLYAKSKRKTIKLRKLLLEKAALASKPKPPINRQDNNAMSIVKVQLTQIQSSLKLLQKSNDALNSKSDTLDLMNRRIIVLEKELGKTDKLVVQLKNSIESLRDDINSQKRTSEKLEQNIKEVESSQSSKRSVAPLIPSEDINNTTNDDEIEAEALRIELTPAEQNAFKYLVPYQYLQVPHEEILLSRAFEEFHPSEIRHASFSQLKLSNITLPKNNTVQSIHQRQQKNKQASQTPSTYSNLINIGAILNGIILIFVLSLLLFNRQTD